MPHHRITVALLHRSSKHKVLPKPRGPHPFL